MSFAPVFSGRVLAGGLLVIDKPKEYAKHVRTLHGRFVEVVVRKQRVKRSLDQNAYLHSVPFPMLAEELGYESIEELKLALMGECWGYHTDKVSGRELPVKPHTSSMTVDECTRFIEWLIQWAQITWNIRIPLPNEAEAA